MFVVYCVMVLPMAVFMWLLDLPVLAIGLAATPLIWLVANIVLDIYNLWKGNTLEEEAA